MSSKRENLSLAILLLLISVYVVWWVVGNWQVLFDPLVNNNDVRIHLIAFHRYAGNSAMANDPLVAQALYMSMPAVRVIYSAIVPLSGVPVASKIVQGICLLLILVSAFLVGRKRAVLPAIVLLLFLFLRTPDLIGPLVGGLPRAFGVVGMIVWTAGALAENRALRIGGILAGALGYPVTMALLMAAEFFLLIARVNWNDTALRRTQVFSELKLYALLGLACMLLYIPAVMIRRNAGRVYSLREAQEEPAFGQDGRLKELPFENPIPLIVTSFAKPVGPAGHALFALPGIFSADRKRLLAALAAVVTIAIMFGVWRKVLPVPKVALCLVCASVVLYAVSRIVAFQLYSPSRYIWFGMITAGTAAVAEVVPQLRVPGLTQSRYGLASVAMVAILLLAGDGVKPRKYADLDERTFHVLYEYFRSTPQDTRIACHPYDGDDVPFWAGRPTTGGYESPTPWFVEPWQRHKAFTEELLQALYATDWQTILFFCDKYGITHLLLNVDRYGPDFRTGASMYEPFGSYLNELLADVDYQDLVLGQVMESPAAFRDGPYVVIKVEDLAALAGQSAP